MEDFFNVFFKCKYKYININYSFKYICVLCYLKLSEQLTEILIIKREMLLEFQNKANVEIILFELMHLGFPLDSSEIDL